MPDSTLSQAIKEAYAAAPSTEIVLHTLEFRHTSFTAPIRVVLDNTDLPAFLESGAPENPGEQVDFIAMQFSLTKPEVGTNGAPEMSIELDNVSPEIEDQMSSAIFTQAVIEVTYRAYLGSDLSGPQNNPPLHMEVKSCRADDFKVTARCSFGNFNNTRFPNELYRLTDYPSLAEVY